MEEYKPFTLNEVIAQEKSAFPYAKGELSRLLMHIGLAAKIVNREINKAGIADILGETGDKNIQGEKVKKLDLYANSVFTNAMKSTGIVCGVASEEDEDIVIFDDHLSLDGKYVICMDPLDGSSNIDVNVSIGTVFSLYRRISPVGTPAVLEDFLQPGTAQVAAGYIIYGSSTMLVYSTGLGTSGFTLDPAIGEFCMSHQAIRTPELGAIYSVNEGRYQSFSEGVKQFIKYCQQEDPKTNRPFASRYIGSLVADFHRNLLMGGVFLYPKTESHLQGKLRLIYECNPVAFLCEHAGGKATDGKGNRILEIKPTSIHERVPFYAGSRRMVDKIEEFIEKYD